MQAINKAQKLRQELSSYALDSLDVLQFDSCEVEQGLKMLESMNLKELKELKRQIEINQ
jgi:hypothetical protein